MRNTSSTKRMGQGSSTSSDQNPISDSSKASTTKDLSQDLSAESSSIISEQSMKQSHLLLVPGTVSTSTIKKESDLNEDVSKNPKTDLEIAPPVVSPTPSFKSDSNLPTSESKTKDIGPTLFFSYTFKIDTCEEMDIPLPTFSEASDKNPVLVCLVVCDKTEVPHAMVVGSFCRINPKSPCRLDLFSRTMTVWSKTLKLKFDWKRTGCAWLGLFSGINQDSMIMESGTSFAVVSGPARGTVTIPITFSPLKFPTQSFKRVIFSVMESYTDTPALIYPNKMIENPSENTVQDNHPPIPRKFSMIFLNDGKIHSFCFYGCVNGSTCSSYNLGFSFSPIDNDTKIQSKDVSSFHHSHLSFDIFTP